MIRTSVGLTKTNVSLSNSLTSTEETKNLLFDSLIGSFLINDSCENWEIVFLLQKKFDNLKKFSNSFDDCNCPLRPHRFLYWKNRNSNFKKEKYLYLDHLLLSNRLRLLKNLFDMAIEYLLFVD